MGHKTIESTMRYLAKAESKKVKAKVDAVQWKKKQPSAIRIGEHAVLFWLSVKWRRGVLR
jgi:hypothetical protein